MGQQDRGHLQAIVCAHVRAGVQSKQSAPCVPGCLSPHWRAPAHGNDIICCGVVRMGGAVALVEVLKFNFCRLRMQQIFFTKK